jgi:amino-acid N-acetyltransferase
MHARIRHAHPCDLPAVRQMLDAAALPTADLDEARIQFLLAEADASLLGVIGLQALPPHGLLRSLCLRADLRGNGLGTQLVLALEQHALQQGCTELTLLTQTAAPFFNRLGYTPLPRAHCSSVIAATSEFRSLCPANAICLHKSLSPGLP